MNNYGISIPSDHEMTGVGQSRTQLEIRRKEKTKEFRNKILKIALYLIFASVVYILYLLLIKKRSNSQFKNFQRTKIGSQLREASSHEFMATLHQKFHVKRFKMTNTIYDYKLPVVLQHSNPFDLQRLSGFVVLIVHLNTQLTTEKQKVYINALLSKYHRYRFTILPYPSMEDSLKDLALRNFMQESLPNLYRRFDIPVIDKIEVEQHRHPLLSFLLDSVPQEGHDSIEHFEFFLISDTGRPLKRYRDTKTIEKDLKRLLKM